MPTPSQALPEPPRGGDAGEHAPASHAPDAHRLAESELTLEAAMQVLEDRGYHEQLHPEGDELRFAGDRRGFHASEFVVEGQMRTESDSTLEYSALILALRHLPSGRSGTLVAPFGTTGDGPATHAVELLEELEHGGAGAEAGHHDEGGGHRGGH